MKKIIIGCDNAGVLMKKAIIKLLKDEGFLIEEIGVDSENDNTIYPVVAEELARRIIKSGYKDEGILVCGTGIGMAIAANKFPGIYAAVCHDIYSAERARLSNNTNVITFGARVIGVELAKKLAKEWINLEFKNGSSTPKVDKIKEIEKRLLTDFITIDK